MSFLPQKVVIIREVFSIINKIPSFNSVIEVDEMKLFLTRVNTFFEGRVQMRSVNFKPSFPRFNGLEFILKYSDVNIIAGGVDIRKEKSVIKSCGEFLERSSTFLPLDSLKENNFETEATRKVGFKNVLAKKITGFGYTTISEKDIYYGSAATFTKEDTYHKTTNGCAGHFSLDKAMLNGWLELIQRDSFFVYWYSGITPRQISLNDEHFFKIQSLQKIKEYITMYNLNLNILDFTSDIGVPTLVCVIHSQSSKAYFGIGACSGFNFEEIFLSAFNEALSVANFSFGKSSPIELDEKYKPYLNEKINKRARMLLYLSKSNFEKIKFLVMGAIDYVRVEDFMKNIQNVSSDSEKLKYLKSIFKKRAENNKLYDVFYYRINNKLIKSFNYYVVRVTCQALYPMYLNERFADPKHPRIKEFLNFKNLPEDNPLNHWPHPFP